MAREIKKKDRICVVCGKTFKGIASAQTCTPACRIDLVRLKDAGKRPEFLLMAKSKGQKIPDLNAPKRLKFKKGEKKPFDTKPIFEGTIEVARNLVFMHPTPESYDAPKIDRLILDEVGTWTPPPTPLTKEQILTKIAELEKEIKIVAARNVLGGSPKANQLKKSMEIDSLNDEIAALKSLLPKPTNPL